MGVWIAVIVIALVAVGFVATLQRGRKQRASDPREAMSPESRSLFNPIRKLVQEIDELANRSSLRPEMKVIAREALDEAHRISAQVAKALVARGEIKRAGVQRGASVEELAELELKVEQATTVAEREALTSALAAKRIELGYSANASDALGLIDASVRQAEAALSELRTRLNLALTSQALETAQDESLRETIGRLKSLTVSVDETESFLKG